MWCGTVGSYLKTNFSENRKIFLEISLRRGSTCYSSSEHLTPSYYLLIHMAFIGNNTENYRLKIYVMDIFQLIFVKGVFNNCWKYPWHLLLEICWRYLYTYWRCLSILYLLKVSKYINICIYWSLAALCSMSRGV